MMALPESGDVYTNLLINPPKDCEIEFHSVKTLSELFARFLTPETSDEVPEEVPAEDSILLDISYMTFDEESKNQMVLLLHLLDLTGVDIVLIGLPCHLQLFKGLIDIPDDTSGYDERDDSLTASDINSDLYPGLALDLKIEEVQQSLLSHGISATVDAVLDARKDRDSSDLLKTEPAWVIARRKAHKKKVAKLESIPKGESLTPKDEPPKVEEELVEDAPHAA